MLRTLVVVLLFVGIARAETSVQELITKLADPAAKVRQDAARQLGYRAKDSARLDPLEKAATSDPDPTVRLAALKGLSPQYTDTGKQPRWKALRVKLMKDADPEVRYEAVSQLSPAEPDTYAAHFAQLKSDKDTSVRERIILSLHVTYAPGLVEALIPLIDDKAIQRTVLSTLGFSKDPRTVPPLLDAVKRELPGSVGALADTEDPRAVDAMLAVLDRSKNAEMRADVVDSIRSVTDGRFVAPLLAMWSKLSAADKALSVKPQEDPMEMMNDLPHSISAALTAIAEYGPAPCDAAKTATGDVKAYLQKILPRTCGGVALTIELEETVKGQLARSSKLDAIYTGDAAFSISGATDEPLIARDKLATMFDGARLASTPWATSAADGKSALVGVLINANGVEWRVSELAVKTANGWRIAGGLASVGQDNKAVNAAAKASKLKLAPLPETKPDAALAGAFAALTKGPLDATAASRDELLAYGSGPKERTTTGGVLARAWKGSWAKHVTVEGPMIARIAPSGTTGFVVANVWLEKPGYKTPFRVLFAFDKVGASWSLIHAHFATAAP